jgi:hypothetical protein
MTNIVVALALSAAALAGAPVPALDQAPQGKDRCELKQDATELTAACQRAPRKNASSLADLTPQTGAFCPNGEGVDPSAP